MESQEGMKPLGCVVRSVYTFQEISRGGSKGDEPVKADGGWWMGSPCGSFPVSNAKTLIALKKSDFGSKRLLW